MSERIDRILAWLKWPVAVLAVFILPGSLWAMVEAAGKAAAMPAMAVPFLAGAILYGVLWWGTRRHMPFGSFFSTLAHELTHVLFALLTWHRVRGLRAGWRQGGHVTVVGRGNWLITIAPYFFPTVCILPGVAMALVPLDYLPWINALMGIALAWHVTSLWSQAHAGQSDLAQVGWPFAAMFLPASNALALGAVLSLSCEGLRGLAAFLYTALTANHRFYTFWWS